jgi:hypothetical protein
LIRLTFRPLRGESSVLARAAYFRICADGTLRGSDNAVAAIYMPHFWQLGQRQFREFECSAPVYLRVTNCAGQRERIGPYDFVRAAEGALFTRECCLGTHSPDWKPDGLEVRWREIALLPASGA